MPNSQHPASSPMPHGLPKRGRHEHDQTLVRWLRDLATAPRIFSNTGRVSVPGMSDQGWRMSWQTIVQQINRGIIDPCSDDRGDIRRARGLGLIERREFALTPKGLDWIAGRLTIERRGNTQGMHQRATWLASLPQGVRI